MEVALGGGAVPEVRERAAPCSRRAWDPIAHSDRVDDLGRDGHADRGEPRARSDRTGPPCHVPRWYWRYSTYVDASHDGRRELAERREHEVVGTQRERAADLRRLLAFERRVDGELSLALERPALAVELSRYWIISRRSSRRSSSDSPTSTSPTTEPSGAT